MNINEYKTDNHVNPEERIHKNIYLLPQLEDNETENEIWLIETDILIVMIMKYQRMIIITMMNKVQQIMKHNRSELIKRENTLIQIIGHVSMTNQQLPHNKRHVI